jgi:hypothetical protein
MEIKIGQFKIVSDSTQFTIYEEKTTGEKAKNSGEIVDKVVGYYSTFESCLKAIPTKALLRSDATELWQAIQVVESYRDMISDALKGV